MTLTANRVELLTALKQLKGFVHILQTGESVKFRGEWLHSSYGICACVGILTDEGRALYELPHLFSDWDKFSGDMFHPVPDPHGLSPLDAFVNSDNKWSGEYGKLRIDLLDFMIQELENE